MSASTDAQGRASARLTLDTQAGININQVTVTVPRQSLTFTATGQPDRVHARLLRVSGNNQQAQAGEVLPEPLVVRLEDQFHNPIVGEQVGGRDPRRHCTLHPDQSNTAAMVTDAEGKASFSVEVSPGSRTT